MKKPLILILTIMMLQNQRVMAGGEKERSVVFKQYTEKVSVPSAYRRRSYGGDKKTTGIILTSVGVASLITSAALLGTTKWTVRSSAGSVGIYSSDTKAIIGGVLIPIGLGLTIPGAIIWGVNSRR